VRTQVVDAGRLREEDGPMAAGTRTATRRRPRLRALIAAAGATAAVTACGQDPSADADRDLASSATAATEANPVCVTAQRRAVREVFSPGLGSELYDSASGTSSTMWLARYVRRAHRAVEVACGEVPEAVTEFALAAREQLTAGTYGFDELDTILDAGDTWASTVGSTEAIDRARKRLGQCAHLADTVHATYRVTGTPDATGTTWEVQLTWDNDSGRRPWGGTGGTVLVTGAEGVDPDWWSEHPSGGLTTGWGGSSADVLVSMHEGENHKSAAFGPRGRVHTSADGTLKVLELYMSAGECPLLEDEVR
jgi:hypothetical protein